VAQPLLAAQVSRRRVRVVHRDAFQ